MEFNLHELHLAVTVNFVIFDYFISNNDVEVPNQKEKESHYKVKYP